MSTRTVVLDEMVAIARDQGKTLPPLNDDIVLLEMDFDSLCFALLVARLEDRLGLDPFSEMASADLPVTVGDLVALYDSASVASA